MKTIIFIATITILTVNMMAQNFVGMSQSKIINYLGTPEEKGDNFIKFVDEFEDGTNTYFFDERGICIEFSITRTNDYFNNYQKLLSKEFTTLADVKIEKAFQSIDSEYMAILNQTAIEFTLRITKSDNYSLSLCLK